MEEFAVDCKKNFDILDSSNMEDTPSSTEVFSHSVDSKLNSFKSKRKGGKRCKKKKGNDGLKKSLFRRDDDREGKRSRCVSPKSASTPDGEMKHSDSPFGDDASKGPVSDGFEGCNDSNETLSMSSLLKLVLDNKKKVLFESDEIVQFFQAHNL